GAPARPLGGEVRHPLAMARVGRRSGARRHDDVNQRNRRMALHDQDGARRPRAPDRARRRRGGLWCGGSNRQRRPPQRTDHERDWPLGRTMTTERAPVARYAAATRRTSSAVTDFRAAACVNRFWKPPPAVSNSPSASARPWLEDRRSHSSVSRGAIDFSGSAPLTGGAAIAVTASTITFSACSAA